MEIGPNVDTRFSPCSTFKMTLGFMGYDAGILKDENTPRWDFHEGYDDWLVTWRAPQTPKTWMHYSCVWYAKLLAIEMGIDTIQRYLASFEYGNQDMSGGLAPPGPTNPAWINSSLAISPREQAEVIKRILLGNTSLSNGSIQKAKIILFKEKLANGWKLFGKTGHSGAKTIEHSWFVGWIEKNDQFFSFAYLIRDKKIDLDQRIPRVVQLLDKYSLYSD